MMTKMLVLLAIGLAVSAVDASCGGKWQTCCAGPQPCRTHLCQGGKCRGAPIPAPKPVPVPKPQPFIPQQPGKPTVVPGVFGVNVPGSVVQPVPKFNPVPVKPGSFFGSPSFSFLGGNGLAQIASGQAATNGKGTTFQSPGFGFFNGQQQAAAQGFGPGAGATNLHGLAGSNGALSFGNGGSGFLLGGGPGAGVSNTQLNGFSRGFTSGTNVHTGAQGASKGGAAVHNNFQIGATGPLPHFG